MTVIGANDMTSSYPLMDAADVGLVYTSTTGMELALAGTPVRRDTWVGRGLDELPIQLG